MNTDIHRLLDQAFAGVDMTPDAQDLKEEIRANLVARVDELESSGVAPGEAAQRAIAELGDVRDLVEGTGEGSDRGGAASAPGYAEFARHRVRPKAGFVTRVTIWSIAAVAGIALGILGAVGVLSLPLGVDVLLFGIAATGLALIVGDALSQETTTNHPMPQRRAGAYALATFLGAFGLGFGGLVVTSAMPIWGLTFAVVGVVAGVVLFAFLGASQTNRHKAWVREMHRTQTPANRFEEEPETAARFGIYTVAIWALTVAAYFVLVPFVGWAWAALAFLVGFGFWMLVLARMLFGARRS
jgi:MFS family permease